MQPASEGVGRSPERIPVRWSDAHKEALRRIASGETPPRVGVDPPLSAALLKCAAGAFDEADAEIVAVLRDSYALTDRDNEIYNSFVNALFTAQRFDILAAVLRQRFGYAVAFELAAKRGGSGRHSVRWEILPSGQHRFIFDAAAYESDDTFIISLLFQWVFPLCAHYAQQPGQERGSVIINLGDIGAVPGLAFCDSRPDRFLVPDTVFIPNKGYRAAREAYQAGPVPWDQRRPVAFWRGATTGMPQRPGDWRSLERVALCEIAQRDPARALFDVGISSVVQFDDPAVEKEIAAAGFFRSFVPWQEWNRYKYHVDIDGNGTAWSALFYRLLTGSPVLKVESRRGLLQWFYDRLAPWQNYVPVAPDMSDLIDKVRWLERNPAAARTIGERGRELADALTYERELARATPVISAAFRYFAGRQGNIGPFGRS